MVEYSPNKSRNKVRQLLSSGAAGLLILGCNAACTTGSSVNADSARKSSPAPASSPNPVDATDSVADLAAKVGCGEVIPEKVVISIDAGRCTIPSGNIAYIRTFSDNNFRGQYLDLITQPGMPLSYAIGDSWVVFGYQLGDNELAALA